MGKKNNALESRDGFRSRWGFTLACIGSAVGMGNIWRFPIMVTKYGGLTFLLPYFLFVVLIGATGIMGEMALGRAAGAGPVGAFGYAVEVRGKNRKIGETIGIIPVIGSLMLAIGYTVVMSWICKYAFMAISGKLYALGTDMGAIGGTFGQAAPEADSIGAALKMMFEGKIFGIGNGVWLIIGQIVALAIMCFGIASGIEKANKVLMPALFGLLVCLGIYMLFVPGSNVGYQYIFTLNPKGLLNPEVWVYAFGQAFFSLSVAGNGTVIYGSYFSKDEAIPASARNVAVFDTIAALLAAFVIIPAIGASSFDPGEIGAGPGLMFVYLVNVINGMQGGKIVGIIFYVCVLFAGISSIVNLYEAPVAFMQEKLGMKRVAAVLSIGIFGTIIALLIQPWTSQWMDIVSIYICPLGACLAGVMFFWVAGKSFAEKQISLGNNGKTPGNWWYPLSKYVYCVLAVVALVVGAIYGGIG